MIKLGTFDPGVSEATRSAYVKQVEQLTRVPLSDVAAGVDRVAFVQRTPDAAQTMSVAEVQEAWQVRMFAG